MAESKSAALPLGYAPPWLATLTSCCAIAASHPDGRETPDILNGPPVVGQKLPVIARAATALPKAACDQTRPAPGHIPQGGRPHRGRGDRQAYGPPQAGRSEPRPYPVRAHRLRP